MNAIGPVEFLVVKFPGNHFTGELAPALADLVESGTISVIDLIFVHKDGAGNVTSIELADLDAAEAALFEGVVEDVEGVLTEEDILGFADMLEANSSAGVLLFENVWAARFAQAVRNAHGEVLLNERIPHEVIELMEELELTMEAD